MANAPIPSLSPETLLLYLAAHGTKHGWQCLGWSCDAAMQCRSAEVNWDRVFAAAKRQNLDTVLSHVLLLLQGLYDLPIPEPARAYVHRSPETDRSDQRVIDSLSRGRTKFLDPFVEMAYLLAFAKNMRAKARLFGGSFLAPSEAEWRALALPPVLYPLYYLFRPVLLAAKHFPRLLGR